MTMKVTDSFSRDLQRMETDLRQSIQQAAKRVKNDLGGLVVGSGVWEGPVLTPKRLKAVFNISSELLPAPTKVNHKTNSKVGKTYCKPGTVCKPVEGSFCTECELCNNFN